MPSRKSELAPLVLAVAGALLAASCSPGGGPTPGGSFEHVAEQAAEASLASVGHQVVTAPVPASCLATGSAGSSSVSTSAGPRATGAEAVLAEEEKRLAEFRVQVAQLRFSPSLPPARWPREVSDSLGASFEVSLRATEAAVRKLATMARSGVPNATRIAGRLLAEPVATRQGLRNRIWTLFSSPAARKSLQLSVGAGAVADLACSELDRRVGAASRRLLEDLPEALKRSEEPAVLVGRACLLALSRGMLAGASALRSLQDEVAGLAGKALPLLAARGDPARQEPLLLDRLLLALHVLGSHGTLREIVHPLVAQFEERPPVRLTAREELLRFSLVAEVLSTVASEVETAPDARAQYESLIEVWREQRGRLLERWPYDPRRGRPARPEPAAADAAALHGEVVSRLADADARLQALAARLGIAAPAEPPRAR